MLIFLYTADQLSSQLDNWLTNASHSLQSTEINLYNGQENNYNVRAIIAPHAGYAYSGETAAYAYDIINPEKINRIFIPKKSFTIYNGDIAAVSKRNAIPVGEFDPNSCNKIRCIIDKANNKKGKKKCRLKNLFKVASFIEKPPHNQSRISFPINGIADIKLVITVAARKLICPQGNT